MSIRGASGLDTKEIKMIFHAGGQGSLIENNNFLSSSSKERQHSCALDVISEDFIAGYSTAMTTRQTTIKDLHDILARDSNQERATRSQVTPARHDMTT